MEDHHLSTIFMTGMFVLFLVGLTYVMPNNVITGNVIKDDVGTCDGLGCLELCDYGVEEVSCSVKGETCCFTHWSSGVCDLPGSCDKIREYSLYQSLELYQDSYRERPSPVRADWQGFWWPIILIVGLLGFFAWQRADPFKHHNKR